MMVQPKEGESGDEKKKVVGEKKNVAKGGKA